jgi:hypothetical protein
MRSLKGECPERMIFFRESSLREATVAFLAHDHRERNHQWLGNQLLDGGEEVGRSPGQVQCRQRLRGMLRYYYRAAASASEDRDSGSGSNTPSVPLFQKTSHVWGRARTDPGTTENRFGEPAPFTTSHRIALRSRSDHTGRSAGTCVPLAHPVRIAASAVTWSPAGRRVRSVSGRCS